jgi:hypothetical protein
MNERIKELTEQAGFNPYNYEGANGVLFKKLAELIVKECAQYIEDKFDFFGKEVYAAEQLRKHFGVE